MALKRRLESDENSGIFVVKYRRKDLSQLKLFLINILTPDS